MTTSKRRGREGRDGARPMRKSLNDAKQIVMSLTTTTSDIHWFTFKIEGRSIVSVLIKELVISESVSDG